MLRQCNPLKLYTSKSSNDFALSNFFGELAWYLKTSMSFVENSHIRLGICTYNRFHLGQTY